MADSNVTVKAEQVANQALGLLERDTVLLGFVWRDPVGNFKGAKNDTVTIKVPAYTKARRRTMRSSTGLVIDGLTETSVDVKLTDHIYKAIRISDEEMTLDITNFGEQVSAPAMGSVVRDVDDVVADLMADSAPEVEISLDFDDPYLGFVDARTALNKHRVPRDQRFLACGANVEAALLKSDRLSKFDQSGTSEALREAIIGRIAGFTALSVDGLDPDIAVAAHKTAYVASLVAPVVPSGAAWGTTESYRGLNLRVIRDYLPDGDDGPADRFLTDTFMGANVTKDLGTLNGDGEFEPWDGTGSEPDPILVRAVTCTLAGS